MTPYPLCSSAEVEKTKKSVMEPSESENVASSTSSNQTRSDSRHTNKTKSSRGRGRGQKTRRGNYSGQFATAPVRHPNYYIPSLTDGYNFPSQLSFVNSNMGPLNDWPSYTYFNNLQPLMPGFANAYGSTENPNSHEEEQRVGSTASVQGDTSGANRRGQHCRGSSKRDSNRGSRGSNSDGRSRFHPPSHNSGPKFSRNAADQPASSVLKDDEKRRYPKQSASETVGGSRGKQIFPSSRGRFVGYRNSPHNARLSNRRKDSKDDDSLQTLRERLKKQLDNNTYECMICCQTIQANQWIWSCSKCFHMFHMNRSNASGCITQWAAKSSDPNGGWRCPSCQNVSMEMPREYKCFCGKQVNPPTRRFPGTPHSCGATCGKSRGYGCSHPCTEECHPGPCCECPAMVNRSCDCGAETRSFRCGTPNQFKCQKTCGKVLECGIHVCSVVCHSGSCAPCDEKLIQKCFCGSEEKEVSCTAENSLITHYSCGSPCRGMYDCGKHECALKCHEKKSGTCGPCPLSPSLKQYCPCGSTKISDIAITLREFCTDPVPTCGNVCNKVLECGRREKPHRCKQLCHQGPCPPCRDNTLVYCRCKAVKKTVRCVEALSYSETNPLLCERRCKKMKSCQNHRCQTLCCIDTEHVCLQVCNKKLDCGNHLCDRLCHVGQCPKCLQASFEEQYCLCGKTVREPPIPCGAPLPECDAPCSRAHACSHPPFHTCHAEPECPPCTVLTEKYCYGKHELRANIPCYLNEVSCGRPCNAPLPCGVHSCNRTCHAPPCVLPKDSCCQPCPKVRTKGDCSHPCGLPCHGTTPCPESDCVAKVQVTCPCFRKKATMRCIDIEKAYRRKMAMKLLESSEERPPSGERKILKRSASVDKYRCLQCDAECRLISRNKLLAEALDIKTDSSANRVELNGVSGVASSMYTDFLKSYLKSNPKHILDIENGLVELVHAVGAQDEVMTKTFAFPPMNSELRRVVHEYATFFNIETTSYDSEPLRNVVATAKKGECRLPLVLLSAWSQKAGPSVSTALASLSLQKSGASSTSKNYSWSSNSGMQQLQSAGKVVKRGFADAARSAK